ncbi:MAG TPA: asparagine--tRNA ligase [Gammaproteobacteria bacterium]|nr:asparagine--tRNA ligase [Gammaproteobacteria bacterium]
MKNQHQVKDLLAGKVEIGKSIEINGWVRSRRDSKAGFSFINLHDGSCFDGIQIIADSKLENYQKEIQQLTTGCSISVKGQLVESQGKGQKYEIQASDIKVLGWVDDPEHYPIAKKRHSFEYLRTVAHLRPRTNAFGAVARVRSRAAFAIHEYFNQNNFFWVNTPIVTASDCEGAGELFRVSTLDFMNLPSSKDRLDFSDDFFGAPTYLTVSGQLNVESYCMALSRVYTFGPTFRAENSNTSRHLAEFWMVEPEIAFADLDDDAALAEDFLKFVIQKVLDECEDDIAFFNQHVDKTLISRLQKVCESGFDQIDYSDAIELLIKSGQKFEFPVKWGLDMQSEHERFICENHFNGPVVVKNYPEAIKSFYMRRNDDEKTCAAMDVLVPGIGELIGGSQREERLDVLDAKMPDKKLREELWWYRELRQYGTVPHAGFGLGFERFISYLTGMENVRDVIPFPRVPGSAPF